MTKKYSHKKYKHLFFDLDRTLWDFDTNNLLSFREIYKEFKLASMGIEDFDAFYASYSQLNLALWSDYKNQLISKESLNFRRFHESLLLYGINNKALAREVGSYYIANSPLKAALYPNTLKTLDVLQQDYQMHIITNGFEEVQYIKLEKSGLSKYFDKIITSERAGYKKPDNRIFQFALKEANALVEESLIIGDDPEADILGAHQVGMDQIWVKHCNNKSIIKQATYEVNQLQDIISIL